MKPLPLSHTVYEKLPEKTLKAFHLKKVFITGGTGFFGKWLLDFFHWLNLEKSIQVKVAVLTRQKTISKEKFSTLHENISFMEGNLLQEIPFENESFDYVIHAGTTTDAKENKTNPFSCFDTIIEGTKHALRFAEKAGVQRFLMVSSGAVYGTQSKNILYQGEDDPSFCDLGSSNFTYHEAKRSAEIYSSIFSENHKLSVSSARCYAFCGPHLPLNQHFAIGNFMDNYLKGEDIIIKGDGTPLRSYMYPSDLVSWLIKILLEGEDRRAYNVGSEEKLSISQTAHLIKQEGERLFTNLQKELPKTEIKTLQTSKGGAPDRYIPKTERARTELTLSLSVSIEKAVYETLKWHLQNNFNEG